MIRIQNFVTFSFFVEMSCIIFLRRCLLIEYKDPSANNKILASELRIQGIQAGTYLKEWPMAFAEINKHLIAVWNCFTWKISESRKFPKLVYFKGEIKTNETFSEFENMREAFFGLFNGENTGKSIIKYTPSVTAQF